MAESIVELNGFVEVHGELKSLRLRVLAARKSELQNDYFCVVEAPLFIGHDKRIFGVDADQARSLAVGFVRSLIADNEVLDGDGRRISL